MGLLGYLAPGKVAKKEAAAKNVEMSEKSAPESGAATPARAHSSYGGTPGNGASPWASRPASLYPTGDFRNAAQDEIMDIKCDMMVNHLYSQQMEKLWTAGGYDEGVVLKKSRNQHTYCPGDLDQEPAGFAKAVQMLNVKCAMTVNTRVIKLFLHNNEHPYVPLQNGLRLQVLPNMSYLPRCAKHQCAAFIADRGILVVWDDQPTHLMKRAQDIEQALMKMIWPDESEEDADEDMYEKNPVPQIVVDEVAGEDGEAYAGAPKPRRLVLIQAFITAFTMIISLAALGAGWRNVAQEIEIDGGYIRLAFVLVYPLQIWVSLFFFQSIVGGLAQCIGPISQLNENTKYYSGVAPKRLNRDNGPLPHVTIQMPVYKEGLQAVIEPTIHSIKAAISTYEMQGGTANIFINDDGMQLIPEEEARARQDFYDEHNIGWVARPRHDPKGEHGVVFVRAGKFKKASNMNYALWVSNRIEEKLDSLQRTSIWTQEDEANAYKDALMEIVDADQGLTWADGNIRMGDYILLIDSDTRVPTDCFLNAVSEMEQSPQVAILQFSSGVMNVTNSYFETGITFFTNLVYTAIRFAVANGDVAPFVGHNAILRWAAVQSIGYDCSIDNREKFWSEATVSEDFDMALRLQSEGFLVRLGGYTGDGFKEGVSLTVYDELARWEKYAYGCSELVFHPFKYWPTRGPFTPLIRRFWMSGMPLASKFTIMAYVGTYFAIGAAWILTLANYFIVGWFNGHIDHYYINSFKVFLSIIVVFSALGNFALSILRYRSEERPLIKEFWNNFKWVPLLTLFLGGISLHVSQALLSHLFSIDMNWGATAKEATNTTFFAEIPKVMRKFKVTFIFCITVAAMMVVLAVAVPVFWRIKLFIAIFPISTIIVSHFFLPIVLNPGLMKFTF